MRNVFVLLVLMLSLSVNGQDSAEMEVQKTVERFFEGFHKQDSLIMKETIGKDPVVQTIGRNKEGETVVKTERIERVLKSIVSIPDSVAFQEKLTAFHIKIDGAMANAWTPYEFWVNDAFHHCGVIPFNYLTTARAGKSFILLIPGEERDAICKTRLLFGCY